MHLRHKFVVIGVHPINHVTMTRDYEELATTSWTLALYQCLNCDKARVRELEGSWTLQQLGGSAMIDDRYATILHELRNHTHELANDGRSHRYL